MIGYVLVSLACYSNIYDCEMKAVSTEVFPTIHECEWKKESQKLFDPHAELKCVEVNRPDKGFSK
jgi:hypothetical protein